MATIDISYELHKDEMCEIVVEDLKDAYKTLIEKTRDINDEDADDAQIKADHILAVLKYYMDRSEFKDFMEELGYEND